MKRQQMQRKVILGVLLAALLSIPFGAQAASWSNGKGWGGKRVETKHWEGKGGKSWN